MSFQIVEILESQAEKILAKVSHGRYQFPVMIASQKAEDLVIGKSFEAEMRYDEILDWKAIDDFEDASSGIWQAKDGIHVLGRIHSILDYGDGRTVVDVYLQNGPEFLTVSSEGIDSAALEGSDGLEITVGTLYISPNDN